MDSQKVDSQLNLALHTPEEERVKSGDLMVGYDAETREWELIIRYVGDISYLSGLYGATVSELLGGYAIVVIKEEYIDRLIAHEEIIYVEKPNNIYVNVQQGLRASCFTKLQLNISDNAILEKGLDGNGVLVACIDSGIDYSHPDFRNDDNTTRIVELWDQTAQPYGTFRPPEGYARGVAYTREQINEALDAPSLFARQQLVPEVDLSGHGTFVAGVAAGNGRASNGTYRGAAYRSELLIVKLGNARQKGFPKTTEMMLAMDYVIKRAIDLRMPVAVNLSYGNNYGSHDGTSLLETYMDVAQTLGQSVICVGAGNEGDAQRHVAIRLENQVSQTISLSVSPYEPALNIQIWKNYTDVFDIRIIAPDETVIGPLGEKEGVSSYEVLNTRLDIYYGMPKPYQLAQEIFIDMIPVNTSIAQGEWKLRIDPKKIVDGKVDFWLPVSGSTNENTRFLLSTTGTSMTVPGTTTNVITVGAYNSRTDAVASFSGRGFTRIGDIKPDIIAPGVDITSCAPGGGYTVKSGTSMATPFATGAAALMMQWGIVNKHDPYLYGEKIKAYLQRGARPLPGFTVYPNPQTGYGALCVSNSLP